MTELEKAISEIKRFWPIRDDVYWLS